MLEYIFDAKTKEYLFSAEAATDPLESEQQDKAVYLLSAHATFVAPDTAPDGYVNVWNGSAWEQVQDNRNTDYWLPEDTWQSPARTMTELGPLPEGALLEKPEKPQSVIVEEMYQDFVSNIQARLDDFAKTRNYDGILSLCSYATSLNDKFKAEGQYGVEARDATWAKGYALLDEVLAGTRQVPTWEEVEAELPVLEWPA